MELLQSLTNYLKFNKVKNLEAWAEDGDLMFSPTSPESGFEIKYSANFEISAIDMEPKRLFMLVVSWIHAFNSEREGQDLPFPSFFSERLDGGNYDIGFKIEFIEQFILVENQNGNWLIEGQRFNLISELYRAFDHNSADYSQLRIVDSHTQDTELKR